MYSLRFRLTEKRKNERNIILLDAAGAVLEYMEAAGITDDAQGPLFRPMTRDGLGYRWSIVRRSLACRNRDQAAQEDGMDSNYRAITGCEDAQSHLTWNLRKIRLANIHLSRPRLRGRRPPSPNWSAEHRCASGNSQQCWTTSAPR